MAAPVMRITDRNGTPRETQERGPRWKLPTQFFAGLIADNLCLL